MDLQYLQIDLITMWTFLIFFFQYFPKFLVELSNILDGSKPARTLLAALSVTLLAGTELIDMVS